MAVVSKETARRKRKVRIRKKISGTAERPRLVVFRSNLHIYAQLVDDGPGRTLVAASTLTLRRNGVEDARCTRAGGELVGREIARLAGENDIARVVFDRNGYLYHGRIKAVADGARAAGLEF
jgi:large subunit ribosomal protein L18